MRKRSSKLKKSSGRRRKRAAHTSSAVTFADGDGIILQCRVVDARGAKNLAAMQLGSLGGKKGGVVRARKLSAKTRSRIARKAAKARWSKGSQGKP